MDLMYFPIISEDDYEAFRSIMQNELPPAYSAWLQRHADRVAHWGKTHRIVEVKVKADDFVSYIREHGRGADLNSLYAFTEFVGKRNEN